MKYVKATSVVLMSVFLQACGSSGGGGTAPDISTGGKDTTPAIDFTKVMPTDEDKGLFYSWGMSGINGEPASLVGDTVSGHQYITKASLSGTDAAPQISGDEVTINGKTYNLYARGEEQSDQDFVQRSISKTSDESGVELIQTIERASADGAAGLIDIRRFDYVFSGTPTAATELPTSTAEYEGTYDRLNSADYFNTTAATSGKFTATADFGAAKTVTGAFYDEADTKIADLTADIVDNQFEGEVTDATSSEANNFSKAHGVFMGSNASSVYGWAQDGDKQSMVFSGDKQ
jgi:hypothetical protein